MEITGKKLPLTNIQLAYLVGRNSEYELGGVSTHAYYEVDTVLDIKDMEHALNCLIKAQPMLRAVVTENGEQVLLDEAPEYQIEITDLCGYSEEETEEAIETYRRTMSHEVFQAGQWPMFAIKALKLAEGKHRILVSLDLLIADGGSIAVLFQEIADHCLKGKEVYQPESSFEEFVKVLCEDREHPKYKKEIAYWKEAVADLPPAPMLPLKRAGDQEKPEFARKTMRLPAERWKKLKAVCNKHGVSETVVLLGIYAKVLSYWCNQKEFTLNYTLSNRKKIKGDIEKVIGDFTSALPVAVRIESDTGFWEQAKRIKSSVFTAYKHVSKCDGLDVIKLIAREKNIENAPVLPVVFTSMLFKNNNFDCIDLIGDLAYSVSQTPQVYLDCQVMEIRDQLSVTWDYVRNLFPEKVMDGMFGHMEQMVNAICEDRLCLNQIFQLDEQTSAFLREYNSTGQPCEAATLYRILKERLRTGGGKIAVKDSRRELSYARLDKLSDQIACRLEKQGIGAGDFVGVLASRCVETIVNIVGVVKSGAAYIPLDPAHPQERRNYILSQSKCRDCLTPEDVTEVWDGEEKPTRSKLADPRDPAYVIYTSGSTGVPKGVVIRNESVCNTILDITDRFGICGEDCFIGISSFCFDLSVYDIFGSLNAGAKMVIVPDSRDIPYIAEVVERENVTVWNTVPAIMELYMDELECGKTDRGHFRGGESRTVNLDEDGLQVVLLSGDWIPLGLPDRIRGYFEDADIYSLGGATEASIWSVYYPIQKVEKEWNSIPYGYPLANQQMYIMNYEGEECPVGVTGEICIGGIGVAAGYQNEPEKTRESFLTTEKYGYLYKTGDYGCMNALGYMEFKGRRDAQVKIRDHRIELGEIENILLKSSDVEKAVVITRKKENGQIYLCAYIVGPDRAIDDELINLAAAYLPEYMIPQSYVYLPELPLTANGKVDRKRLPEPESKVESYAAPRNEDERSLQEIWESVLDNGRIGIHDNFFEIGGDSISMVRIAGRIEEAFQKKVPLQMFLKHPTIAEMAAAVKREQERTQERKEYKTTRIPLEEQLRKEYPLTDVQMAYLVGSEDSFELGGISAHAFYEVETKLDIDRFEAALNKLIERQPMLRTIMTADLKQKLIAGTMYYRIERVDLSELSEDGKRERLEEMRRSMTTGKSDPFQWPLFSFRAVELGEKCTHLLIDFNLLISDGTSMRILVEELMKLYHEPAEPLKPMEYTFLNYIMDKKQIMEGEKAEEDRRYWMEKVHDFPEAPHVTRDIQLEKAKEMHYERKEMTISKERWGAIKNFIKEKGVSPSAALETVYSYVLAYWSDQPHHGINITVFNRYPFHEDVENMIGDFTSVMLLDVDLDKKSSFWENAQKVQNRLLEGMEHNTFEGIQFIRELSKERGNATGARMPIVFTSMIFHDRRFEELDNFGDVVYSISQTPQVYLDCQVMEINDKLSVTWDYVREMFEEDRIENMFCQFEKMINGMDDTSRKIDEVPRPDRDTQNKIAAYNATAEEIPETTLYELIKPNLCGLGAKIAVKDSQSEISYAQLDKMSDQVAYDLQSRGIGAGDFVGVLAERCVETIVNIVGIVKSGAAYVPLSVSYPKERKEYILAQSNSRICLTKEDAKRLGSENKQYKAAGAADKDSPAYVIYTSGSTGRPKGVLIANKAVCNTIIDVNKRFGITQEDKVIGISSYCFDLSVYDIFGSLLAGATHVIAPEARDIPQIADLVEKEGITVWNTVPAIMELYMEEIEQREKRKEKENFRNRHVARSVSLDEEGLSVILLSGDWIPLNLPERIWKKYEDARIYSLGGATEASIWSIYYPIQKVDPKWKSIPYGYPLANQTFYVMNYAGSECPVGVIGELYIGGRGVADGYQNEPEKTKEAFFTHPEYGYMYKTGDYGVLNREGYIEFKGRRDAQVKIRGHRIELEEIETVLMRSDKIERAVVVPKKKKSGQEYLCAYLVAETMPEEKELRQYAERFLPDYMVPQTYIKIPQLALTANGKVDKKNLPEAEETLEEYIEPRNEGERRLQEIWEKVLGRERISMKENFFEAGGDSIAMVRIANLIEEDLKKRLPFQTFLQNPTIAEMAAALEERSDEKYQYFMFPDIYGIGTVMKKLIDADIEPLTKCYDIPADRTLDGITEDYVRDILSVKQEGKITLIGYSLGGNIAFEVAKRLEEKNVEVDRLILLDSYFVGTSDDYSDYREGMLKKTGLEDSQLLARADELERMLKGYHTAGRVEKTALYYIEAEGDDDFASKLRQKNHCWDQCCANEIKRRKGKGIHPDMLNGTNIEANRNMIKEILQEDA